MKELKIIHTIFGENIFHCLKLYKKENLQIQPNFFKKGEKDISPNKIINMEYLPKSPISEISKEFFEPFTSYEKILKTEIQSKQVIPSFTLKVIQIEKSK